MVFTQSTIESAPAGGDLEGHTVVLEDYPTPNLMDFKNEAVVFPKAFCASPKCTPSRWSTLTGRYGTRNEVAIDKTLKSSDGSMGVAVELSASHLDEVDSLYSIPSVLSNNGYLTGMVGKWHLMPGNDLGYNYGCMELGYGSDSALYEKCREVLQEQCFDFVDAYYEANIVTDKADYGHSPEWMVSQAQRFIDQAQGQSKPFFLYFAATLMHNPNWDDGYDERDTPKGRLSGNDIPNDTHMKSREELNELLEAYKAVNGKAGVTVPLFIAADDMIGALFQYLKDLDIYDNTYVVIQNDHGQEAKGQLYLQGSRILTYVRYPPLFGKAGPMIMPSSYVVSNVDIAATVFDLADATLPDAYVLDGVSYLDDVVAQLNDPDSDMQTSCRYKFIDHHLSHSIVSGQYQYIYRSDDNVDQSTADLYKHAYDQEQLYDTIADPDQKVNLITERDSDIAEELEQTVALFETMMRAYLNDVCPIDGPNYVFSTTWGGPVPEPTEGDSVEEPEPTSCSDMECCSDDDCTKRKKPSCIAGTCAAAPPCEFECCSDSDCGRREECLEDNTCGTPTSSGGGSGDGSCSSDSDCARREECKEGVCAAKERGSRG